MNISQDSALLPAGDNQINISEDSTVLTCWKDIARYLGKGVRTVQRWERHLGLPVRRPTGASQKSAVVLHRGDVDAWLATRFSARSLPDEGREGNESARSTLKERIRTARELRMKNQILAQQIAASIRLLNERCDLLNTQALREPWRAGEPLEGELTIPELLPSPPAGSDHAGSEGIV
jgi:hypothetical protein